MNHCLEKNPEARFHSARDVAFALEALSGSASSSTRTVAMPGSVRWTRNSERLVWIVVSALLLASAIAFGLLYFRRPPAQTPTASRGHVYPPEKARATPGSFTVSPDGRRVIMRVISEGKVLLWARADRLLYRTAARRDKRAVIPSYRRTVAS